MDAVTFGQTLRSWREAAPLELTAGLAGAVAVHRRRRTPGLRREELAALAGVSAHYLQRLEQDRARPGRQVVVALGRGLSLNRDAVDDLLALAGYPPERPQVVSRTLTPGVQRLLRRITVIPVAVYDAAWTWVTANEPWRALFPGQQHGGWRSHNLVWMRFTGGDDHVRHDDEEYSDAFLVADLKRAATRYPNDPELGELITALGQVSARFRRLWEGPVDAGRVGGGAVVVQTSLGPLTLDVDVLSTRDSDLHLAVFSAEVASGDELRLRAAVAAAGGQGVDATGQPLVSRTDSLP